MVVPVNGLKVNHNDFVALHSIGNGIHEQSQPYLRFVWQGQAYQFQALPFGLCTAPRVFTKLLKSVITFLRTHNIPLLIYLDDILIVGADIITLQEQTNLVLDLLQSLGFIINFEKSVLTPSPTMEFLGLLVDSRTMMFYLPSHKVTKAITLCHTLLQNRAILLLSDLAQLLGFLESTRLAIWLAPLHFRHLQYCLIQQLALNQGSYDSLVSLHPLAKEELRWWIANIHRVNSSLLHPPSNNQGQLVCTGTITTHKRARAQGSLLSNPILSKAQSKHGNKIAARQYNCSRLCEQQGGHTFTRTRGTDPGVMEVVSEQGYLHSSSSSARNTELLGGQRVENMHRPQRLTRFT